MQGFYHQQYGELSRIPCSGCLEKNVSLLSEEGAAEGFHPEPEQPHPKP